MKTIKLAGVEYVLTGKNETVQTLDVDLFNKAKDVLKEFGGDVNLVHKYVRLASKAKDLETKEACQSADLSILHDSSQEFDTNKYVPDKFLDHDVCILTPKIRNSPQRLAVHYHDGEHHPYTTSMGEHIFDRGNDFLVDAYCYLLNDPKKGFIVTGWNRSPIVTKDYNINFVKDIDRVELKDFTKQVY